MRPSSVARNPLCFFCALALSACVMVEGVNQSGRAAPARQPAASPASSDTRQPETAFERNSGTQTVPEVPPGHQTFKRDEIIAASKTFFGNASEDLARLIQRAFADYGEPVAYIEGEEGSGAFIAGLRYGQGYVQYKGGGRGPIFWQGPSVGYDFGGNASKVFTLIYNLDNREQLFQRFPGVDGSIYVVAGFGLNYQKSGDVVMAPIRTGVGLRAGASVGYLHYTRAPSILPF